VSNSRKRIAIVTQDPANYGGVLRLVEFIYRRAESAGMEPIILHYAKYAEHPELHASISNLFRGEINLMPQEKHYQFRGMNARAIGARFPEWEPQRIRSNALWRKALSEYDSFILVTGSAQTGLPLVQSEKKFAAWISATVEDDRRKRLGHSHGLAATLERLGMKQILRAESQVLKSASQLLAVSEDTKKHIAQISERPSEVWPFPIDTVKFSPAKTPVAMLRPRFLFVGRANDPRKRIKLFLASCIVLNRIHPDLDFSIAVVSSTNPDLRNLPFRAEWISNASDEALIELYRTSAALMLTSEQEGLGIAAMEAMACGLPVISTRCGGPETFIEDRISGFFVTDDPEVIAERMFDLATNESHRLTIGEAARQRIERSFSEHVWNRKFEDLLIGINIDLLV
jgi:glycosyltransferase involved in cell wall biosynthesis